MGVNEILVEERDFLFEIPLGLADQIEPTAFQFGTLSQLIGQTADWRETQTLTLAWQASGEDQTDYTTFVHLKNSAGEIVEQIDRPLDPSSSQWVANQIILTTFTLPLNPDITSIAFGLYDPTNGQRLPIINQAGEELPNRQVDLE